MSIVFVAAIWFVLGVVVCFLSGRGIADAQSPSRPSRPAPAAPNKTAPRRFAALPVHEWTLAAEQVALDELLAPTPGIPSSKV